MVKKVSVCTQIEQTIKDILRLFREQEEEIIKKQKLLFADINPHSNSVLLRISSYLFIVLI